MFYPPLPQTYHVPLGLFKGPFQPKKSARGPPKGLTSVQVMLWRTISYHQNWDITIIILMIAKLKLAKLKLAKFKNSFAKL